MSNSIKMGMRRSPYAFTELGVAMLSSVLNSKAAIQINMSIMRAFVAIRQLIANPPVDRVGELEKQMRHQRGYPNATENDQPDVGRASGQEEG